jgi:membrane-bound lytic murein transglycosylase A
MRAFPLAALLISLALPAAAQSPTLTPVNPKTAELWAKPPFGADAKSLRAALANSCSVFAKRSASAPVSADSRFGTNGQWQSFCTKALAQSNDNLETYITDNLQPLTLAPEGKFTGYYKPVVEGSLTHHGEYQTPILAKPDDLVKCKGATGQKKADGSCVTPYPNRAGIEKNLDKYKVLVWLKDPIDAYFIHIQGSALVELDDGGTVYISFAAKNGWSYVAIGKVLKDMGELKGDITAQKIRDWLALNPTRMNEILQKNPSFIFFRKATGSPRGALGVPLVAGRSLAVDRKFIPLGLPVVIKTTTTHDSKPWQRVMMAQDIGSAITGGARGDIFFGLGPYAGDYAGDQNATGTLQVLVPKEVKLDAASVSETTPLTPLATVTPTIVISQTAVSMNTVSDTVAPMAPISETIIAEATSPTQPVSDSTITQTAQSLPANTEATLAQIEPAAGPAPEQQIASTEETPEVKFTAKAALEMVGNFVTEHLSAPDPTASSL